MGFDRDLEALNQRRSGSTVPEIVAAMGFRSREACEKALERARKARGLIVDPVEVRAAELDRLEGMQALVARKVDEGVLSAVDTGIRLAGMRLRLAGIVESGRESLTAAVEETVAALNLRDVDKALVASARRLAQQIDSAGATGDATAETKAMYLIPHLTNVLRELGATPVSRGVEPSVEPEKGARSDDVDEFTAFKASRGRASQAEGA